MKPHFRILVCDPIDEKGINKLEKAGFIVDVESTIEQDELMKKVADYDILIVRGRTKVTKELLDSGRKLKAVGRAGAGLDNIDLKAAEARGLRVLNTPEAAGDSVAELTFGLIISLARRIPYADESMKAGRWVKDELMGWELCGRTLGIIGLGNVGERVARLAKAFGMNIIVTKRTPPDPALLRQLKAEFVSLQDLLARSDIVTIHVPYTPETHHMIGEKELSLMKKGASLINTSRGGIVDQQSLLRTLQAGKLRGAALDVFEVEPPADWTLMRLPNVICTPHIGAQTEEAQKAASVLLAERIIGTFS